MNQKLRDESIILCSVSRSGISVPTIVNESAPSSQDSPNTGSVPAFAGFWHSSTNVATVFEAAVGGVTKVDNAPGHSLLFSGLNLQSIAHSGALSLPVSDMCPFYHELGRLLLWNTTERMLMEENHVCRIRLCHRTSFDTSMRKGFIIFSYKSTFSNLYCGDFLHS